MHDITLIDEILRALQADETIETKEQFQVLRNAILAKTGESTSPAHIVFIERYNELVASGEFESSNRVRRVLRKRAVRSLSGVAVISLLTKFWGCPGKCIYCPTYEGLPKSYISDEPAVQRAEMNDFDPYLQVQNRLSSLQITGNAISKCDVRVIGGTWSVYPREYQEDFIKQIYDAHNAFGNEEGRVVKSEEYKESLSSPSSIVGDPSISTEQGIYSVLRHEGMTKQGNPFSVNEKGKTKNYIPSTTLEEAKKKNESATSRVIGIAIETRPDWIDEEEIKRLRRYGITRVEIGYQTTNDAINELNKRGHGNTESIRATRLLKDAGFKVVAHMMPGLVGSTPDIDKASMREVWDNQAYRPDEIKIYPLVVTPHSELTEMWERGEFEPYDDATLIPLMAEVQSTIPEYVRLLRMYRDIPAHEILAGSKIANLRQVTEVAMRARGLTRHDISAREIRAKGNSPDTAIMDEYFYEASDGHEYFLQMIDPSDRTIFALLRLRIPSQYFSGEKHFIEVLNSAAIVRELHVFGDQIPVGETGNASGQHMGFGKRLMARAEEIVREQYSDIEKVAVIAGVGVRGYYAKRGYTLEDEYMVKYLKKT